MADTTLKEAAVAGQPKQSLVDMTLNGLVDMIIALGAGASIPRQDVLAKQFGVSRTVLREALVILVFLNVLTVKPKVGTRVTPPAQWKVFNYEVVNWRGRAGETTGLMDAARLSNAAPALLDAAQKALALIELCVDGDMEPSDEADWLRAAIAKAEGR